MKRIFRKYQKHGYYYCKKTLHSALFWDKRLGKSIVTIRSMRTFFRDVLNHVLIIAPYSALYGWEKELLKEGYNDLSIQYLTGSREQREKSLIDGITMFSLINADGFRGLPEIINVNWDCVIFDESSLIKNPNAQITRFYCNNFRNAKKRYILNGDPMPESMLDIYSQLEFLDDSILPFDTFNHFKYSLFRQDFTGYKWLLKGKMRNRFYNIVKGKLSFLSRHSVSLGGEHIREVRKVKLPDKAMKTYKILKKDLILQLENKIITGFIYDIQVFTACRRLFGGIIENKLYHRAKIDELIRILKNEIPKEQVVIWCDFVNEVELIHTELTKRKLKSDFIISNVKPIERMEKADKFNSGKFQYLIVSSKCSKFGADFSGADTQIYYSTPLAHLTRSQTEDRIVTVEKDNVLTIDLICDQTIEVDIYKNVISKGTQQQLYINILQGA